MTVDFARCQFGQEEIDAVNRVMKGYWLASGEENESFEQEFATYTGSEFAVCVNSGSSANLIALASLELPKGSKVLTSACGFPATLNPILHLGLSPVFVDYDLDSHNININQVLEELANVKAAIFAHTLGNPIDLKPILGMAELCGTPIIEDSCEAIGTKIDGRSVGSFGKLGTFSFYPSHQMTAGGAGGMVVTNDRNLMYKLKSMRDWGKKWDWNEKLGDNKTCYTEDIGLEYPYYPHYVYHTVGWNFKLPEICAAFGREQLKRIDSFSAARQENFEYLKSKLSDCRDLIQIKYDPTSKISWFTYPITIRDGSRMKRNELGDYLEDHGIRHRPFFAGNILAHKPYQYLARYNHGFPIADKLMKDSLFVGCWPGMTKSMLNYIARTVLSYADYCRS